MRSQCCLRFSFNIKVHLNWNLKWVFLTVCRPPSIHPSICRLSVHLSFWTTGIIPTQLGTKHLWVKVYSSLFKWRVTPTYIGNEIAKTNRINLIISRTDGLVSTKLGTTHSWVMGIHVFSNKDYFIFKIWFFLSINVVVKTWL